MLTWPGDNLLRAVWGHSRGQEWTQWRGSRIPCVYFKEVWTPVWWVRPTLVWNWATSQEECVAGNLRSRWLYLCLLVKVQMLVRNDLLNRKMKGSVNSLWKWILLTMHGLNFFCTKINLCFLFFSMNLQKSPHIKIMLLIYSASGCVFYLNIIFQLFERQEKERHTERETRERLLLSSSSLPKCL